ncbi:MAG: DUF1559 domain-containing protein [Planctomycetales bacterium]|nr:DUF1559 domain-containing protein [Planctomycetales bacterium]
MYTPKDDIDSTSISVFQCPSDGATALGTNYRVCMGPDAQPRAEDGGGRGPFVSYAEARTNIPRGLSNVVSFAERLRSNSSNSYFQSQRDIWFAGLASNSSSDVYLTASELAVRHPPKFFYRSCGHSWYSQLAVFTAYNHLAGPNSGGTALVQNPWGGSVVEGLGYVIPSTSNHSAGVNVARCDGSVSLVADGIDVLVWRALGTAIDGS